MNKINILAGDKEDIIPEHIGIPEKSAAAKNPGTNTYTVLIIKTFVLYFQLFLSTLVTPFVTVCYDNVTVHWTLNYIALGVATSSVYIFTIESIAKELYGFTRLSIWIWILIYSSSIGFFCLGGYLLVEILNMRKMALVNTLIVLQYLIHLIVWSLILYCLQDPILSLPKSQQKTSKKTIKLDDEETQSLSAQFANASLIKQSTTLANNHQNSNSSIPTTDALSKVDIIKLIAILNVILIFLSLQLAFSLNIHHIYFFLKDDDWLLLIACGLYPLTMGFFKFISNFLMEKQGLKYSIVIEMLSLTFASLPYRTIYLIQNDYPKALIIIGIKSAYKFFYYVVYFTWFEKLTALQEKIMKLYNSNYKSKYRNENERVNTLIMKFNFIQFIDIYNIIGLQAVFVLFRFLLPSSFGAKNLLYRVIPDDFYQRNFVQSCIELGVDIFIWISFPILLKIGNRDIRTRRFWREGLLVISSLKTFLLWANVLIYLIVLFVLSNQYS